MTSSRGCGTSIDSVKIARALLAGLAIAAPVAPAEAAAGLVGPRSYSLPIGARNVTIGDVNQDGRPDVVVPHSLAQKGKPGGVAVLFARPEGTLRDAYDAAVDGDGSESAAIADFDKNGEQDLALTNTLSDEVAVVPREIGVFLNPRHVPAQGFPIGLAVADFDKAQEALDPVTYPPGLDLLVWSYSGTPHFALLRGRGDGTFGPVEAGPSTAAAPSAGAAKVLQLNGDAYPDLAALDFSNPRIDVFAGNGTGGFAPLDNHSLSGGYPTELTTGDFNRDGKLDLAAAVEGAGNANGYVAVLAGKGGGLFEEPVPVALPSQLLVTIASGDFNGDRRGDLAVGDAASPTTGNGVWILAGKGDGTFRAARRLPLTAQASHLRTADFNRDGRSDLAVRTGAGKLALFRARPPRPVLSGLAVDPEKFRRGTSLPHRASAPDHTTISFRLSIRARVKMRFERATRGRLVGDRCGRQTSSNRDRRACTRYVRLSAGMTVTALEGVNRIGFSGRLSKNGYLDPGRYRLVAWAKDFAGQRSKVLRARFVLLPR
jgi:VCBS repeat protein